MNRARSTFWVTALLITTSLIAPAVAADGGDHRGSDRKGGVPPTPVDVQVYNRPDGSVRVEWSMPGGPRPMPNVAFRVLRSVDDGPLAPVADVAGASFVDDTLTIRQGAAYVIVAYNKNGESAPSEPVERASWPFRCTWLMVDTKGDVTIRPECVRPI